MRGSSAAIVGARTGCCRHQLIMSRSNATRPIRAQVPADLVTRGHRTDRVLRPLTPVP